MTQPANWCCVNPRNPVFFSEHSPDNEFIAVAIEAPADYLITSNKRHFQRIPVDVINVAGNRISFHTPSSFISLLYAAKAGRVSL
jgi:predicted nucleic acid-binding protein